MKSVLTIKDLMWPLDVFLDDFEGDILPEKMMYIQFEDMSEIATLIRLLTEFKEQSKRRYIGDWRGCILPDVEHS